MRAASIHSRRRGYVLLATLGLLVLCATLLVSLSRLAIDHALRSRLAEDELQRRWGAHSCVTTVLANGESFLREAESRQKHPVASLKFEVRLGKHTFDLLLADEQAKVNVNFLLDATDRPTAENRIRQSLTGSGLGNSLRLRPDPTPPPIPQEVAPPLILGMGIRLAPVNRRHITGLGQIFDLTQTPPERLFASGAPHSSAPLDMLTCWTTGHINIRRASEPALRLAYGPSLTRSQIAQLVEGRNSIFAVLPPFPNLAIPTRRVELEIPQTAGVPPASEITTCHSLWITIKTPHRRWVEFHAMETSDPLRPRLHSFIW